MGRLTLEQRVLSELLQRLITIFYGEGLRKSSLRYSIDQVNRLLKEFPECLPEEFAEQWVERTGMRSLFRGANLRTFDELRAFRNIMEHLREAILDGQFHHFELVSIDDSVETKFFRKSKCVVKELPDAKDKARSEYMDDPPKFALDRPWTRISIGNWPDLQRPVSTSVTKSLRGVGVYSHGTKYFRISSETYRVFHVTPLSPLARTILYTPPYEEVPTTVFPIWFQTWSSFIEVVRSILVSFNFYFGDFRRLKTCAVCGKLCFEEKDRRRKYCSRACRKTEYVRSEPRDKRLCRERQNAWVRTHVMQELPRPYTILKSDCHNCANFTDDQGPLKGGRCKLAIEKNRNNLSQPAIERAQKRPGNSSCFSPKKTRP